MKDYGKPLPVEELVALARTLKPSPRMASSHPTIAGSSRDQAVPNGMANPLWEIIRHIPSDVAWRGDGIEPNDFHVLMADGYRTSDGYRQLARHALCARFAWSIPSPGDMRWLAQLLDGRGVVEIGAGSGYWAWQMAQTRIDVLAYDPNLPGPDNRYVKHELFHPVLPGDDRMAAHFPDRALLLCWPPYATSMAADTLRAYDGDLLVYVGEPEGGCTGDDEFHKLLDSEWDEAGASPFHVTWSGIHCYMTAYRRRVKAVEA